MSDQQPPAWAMERAHSAYDLHLYLPNHDAVEFIYRCFAKEIAAARRDAFEASCAAICFGCERGWERGYDERYDPEHRTLMHRVPGVLTFGHKCGAAKIVALASPQSEKE